jgi:hypothetical protein
MLSVPAQLAPVADAVDGCGCFLHAPNLRYVWRMEKTGPRYKVIIDPRTTIYVKTDEALKKWTALYPKAKVTELV